MRAGTMTAVLGMALVLGAAGCRPRAEEAPAPAAMRPERAPDVTGVVRRLTPLAAAVAAETGSDPAPARGREEEVGVVMVEALPGTAGRPSDAARVTLSTRILRSQGGRLVPADWGKLEVGQRVELWYAGPVAESYPRQGAAGTLVIVLEPRDPPHAVNES